METAPVGSNTDQPSTSFADNVNDQLERHVEFTEETNENETGTRAHHSGSHRGGRGGHHSWGSGNRGPNGRRYFQRRTQNPREYPVAEQGFSLQEVKSVEDFRKIIRRDYVRINEGNGRLDLSVIHTVSRYIQGTLSSTYCTSRIKHLNACLNLELVPAAFVLTAGSEEIERRLQRELVRFSVRLMRMELSKQLRYQSRMRKQAQLAHQVLSSGMIHAEEFQVLENVLRSKVEQITISNEEQITEEIEDLVNKYHLEEIYNRLRSANAVFARNGRGHDERRGNGHERRHNFQHRRPASHYRSQPNSAEIELSQENPQFHQEAQGNRFPQTQPWNQVQASFDEQQNQHSDSQFLHQQYHNSNYPIG